MAEGTIGIAGERSAYAKGTGPAPPRCVPARFPAARSPSAAPARTPCRTWSPSLSSPPTATCAARAATRRPLAAGTVRLVEDALVAGDYYDRPTGGGEPIAAFAWPMLLQPAAWPGWPGPGSS